MSVAVVHEYCDALSKQANCQVAVSVHGVSETVSCSLRWRLFVTGRPAGVRELAHFGRRRGTCASLRALRRSATAADCSQDVSWAGSVLFLGRSRQGA